MPFESKHTFSSCRDVKSYLRRIVEHVTEMNESPGRDTKHKVNDFITEEYNNFKSGIDAHCKRDTYQDVDDIVKEVFAEMPEVRPAAIAAKERIRYIFSGHGHHGYHGGVRSLRRSTRKKAKHSKRTRRVRQNRYYR